MSEQEKNKDVLEFIRKAGEVLDAQDVPAGNRTLRYVDDNGITWEVRTDKNGDICETKQIRNDDG